MQRPDRGPALFHWTRESAAGGNHQTAEPFCCRTTQRSLQLSPASCSLHAARFVLREAEVEAVLRAIRAATLTHEIRVLNWHRPKRDFAR